jgi:hypothetical protein
MDCWEAIAEVLDEASLEPDLVSPFNLQLYIPWAIMDVTAIPAAWCRGLLKAVETWPEDWRDFPDRMDLDPAWRTIKDLAEGKCTDAIASTATEEGGCLSKAVLQLYTARKALPF